MRTHYFFCDTDWYSFFALGAQQWAFKGDILKFDYILTPKGINAKTKLTINFMKRKIKEYDELKKIIANGGLGKIHTIQAEMPQEGFSRLNQNGARTSINSSHRDAIDRK